MAWPKKKKKKQYFCVSTVLIDHLTIGSDHDRYTVYSGNAASGSQLVLVFVITKTKSGLSFRNYEN